MTSDDRAVGDNWLRAVNDHLGARIRFRRKQLGLSQTQLGENLGLTFQQVQKYEHGSNRISAARLLDMARVMTVPVTYFYEEMIGQLRDSLHSVGLAEGQDAFKHDSSADEATELLQAFSRIKDSSVRQNFLQLVKSLAIAKG